jgi:hypothetical protein
MRQLPQLTWDVRANAVRKGTRSRLSILAKAPTREAAELEATQQILAQGWADVVIEWAVLYPPSRPRAARTAITDD